MLLQQEVKMVKLPFMKPVIKLVTVPDEVRCTKCKRHFDLPVLRERKDYKTGICPMCGGYLHRVKRRVKC